MSRNTVSYASTSARHLDQPAENVDRNLTKLHSRQKEAAKRGRAGNERNSVIRNSSGMFQVAKSLAEMHRLLFWCLLPGLTASPHIFTH